MEWDGFVASQGIYRPRETGGVCFVSFFYVSPTLIARHHGKVELDGRPRDVGVYEGSTITILKWGSTGEVSNSFLIPSQGVPYSRSTPIWGQGRGGN